MIEFQEKEGQLIPVENGQALCATAFQDEAALWVKHQDLSAPIAVIIGLGAGHHVRAWLEANADSHAIVIDSRAALIQPFASANADLEGRYDVLVIDSVGGLMKHEILAFVAETLPPILSFRPAFGAQADLFETFFATLTGRNRQGLRYFLDSFGFKDTKIIDVAEDGRLLTIKDLGVVVDAAHEGHPKASAVKVLKELVV